jgi:outer membrane protein TolC
VELSRAAPAPSNLAGVQAAGQRPNQEVSVEAERETPHWSFGSVPIEVSGKRQRRIDVAQATLNTTEAETARVMAEVRSDVRRAYFSAVGQLRRLEAAQELEGINSRSAVSPWASTNRRGRCRPSPAPDRV